jgi:hypothetical protein
MAYTNFRTERTRFAYHDNPVRYKVNHYRPIFKSVRADYNTYHYRRNVFYTTYAYTPPVYAYQSYPRFGIWDATFLWFMLDHCNDRQYALMYYNHQNDEAMRLWRSEADRMALENAVLRERLAVLDQQMAYMNGTPQDPTYMPMDAQDVALAAEAIEEAGVGGGWENWPWLWIAICGGIVVIAAVIALILLIKSRKPTVKPV